MSYKKWEESLIVRASASVQWECLTSEDADYNRMIFESFHPFMEDIFCEILHDFCDQNEVLAMDIFWNEIEYFARMFEIRASSLMRGEDLNSWKLSSSWAQYQENARKYIEKQNKHLADLENP
jgi:hypothetical protein